MPKRKPAITEETIAAMEKLIGLTFTDAERALMVKGLGSRLADYDQLRMVPLENSVAPALRFDPRLPGMTFDKEKQPLKMGKVPPLERWDNLEELAFYPVTHLAQLIQTRQVSSVELTEMCLNRLKRYNPILKCVVTLTEELALTQAKRADAEIANGNYRGPLHGVPWGAKDLLATRGIPTTWGAMPYKEQVMNTDATVVERLEAAGAVLVAKLTTGALAMGDMWFDGQTKNPWDIEEGSSGSSAGPASATAGGLVGFSIGSETRGSIVSPSTRCGVTGLRPTFGRVSRHGVMALSWSMDKLGPMCRSVEDCAVVFDAIYGPDGTDSTVVDLPFNWNADLKLSDLRIGYVKSAFDASQAEYDDQTLEVLRQLDADLIPIELPDYPIEAIGFILLVEAAAAFDELTRNDQDDLLVQQGEGTWPNLFRQARLIPAVEYIQANRVRTRAMQEMAALMTDIDVYLHPTHVGINLGLTNLTGHPAVVVPNGFTPEGAPTHSITFVGKLYGEAETLAVAKIYQDATDFHLKHPEMDYE